MRLAFCLINYFPFGGLQRDFLRIALACQKHNHQIDIYTMRWQGEIPAGMRVHLIHCKALTNHARYEQFNQQVQKKLQSQSYDLVVGFNKMPNLDIYYAADGCFVAREHYQRSFFLRYLPRYRAYAQFERAVFSPEVSTEILLISPAEKIAYQKFYQTPDKRMHLLPPGIARDRVAPANADSIRETTRKQLGITEKDFALLLIGSSFKTKGLDRAIQALAALHKNGRNNTHLYVLGMDKTDIAMRLSKKLGVLNYLHCLTPRESIINLLLAADVLVHPARFENTGTVLLEALVAGLPILATDICGYAPYILAAECGALISAPFSQSAMNAVLNDMLDREKLKQYQKNALAYSKHADLFSLIDKAVEWIEKMGARNL